MDSDIILIDAGTGNLRSVYKAMESLGARVTMTRDPDRALRGSKIVLPGVGAFGDFMSGLHAQGMDEAVIELKQAGKPLLGICVGMQSFFDIGEEMGEHKGLGLLHGRVVRFPDQAGLKIPHTGWNQLYLMNVSPLWQGLTQGDFAYFNHSYYCAPDIPQNIIASTDYGVQFTSAVQYENLFGVQFHPEKSQQIGLKILANFLHL
jgi:imidazole glycerol-phosphate synthase subunit HisH